MDTIPFKAFQVEENTEQEFTRKIVTRSTSDLPPGDILVQTHYSSLNYKDALSASGNRGVTRNYPHTPGIDAAGVVAQSRHKNFKPGQKVIVSGYDLGMNIPGGFGQYIRVPSGWALPCPDNLSLKESMIFGTAGFTAALSVQRLLDYGIRPEQGQVLVTGASGGVGSIAVALLAKEGFKITAVSGKTDQEDYLKSLGAEKIIPRDQAIDVSNRSIMKELWSSVIDTVGGPILATAIKSTKYSGAVTCCGNVASPDLTLTVYPFILRGISLFGIDSARCAMATREKIWSKIAEPWKLDLDGIAEIISLNELEKNIDLMLKGRIKGRIVLRHDLSTL